MKIKRLIGGNIDANGYVIYQKDGGSCYIIDPGYNPDRYLKFVKECKLKLAGILLTHHHYDHVGGVVRIAEAKDCPVYIHREDADLMEQECGRPADVLLEDGDVLDLDGEQLLVVHTPGHTWGGVCFYSEKSKLAFTGDTVFNVDLGRTDLRDSSQAAMENSIRGPIEQWSNEITIYPGHGDSCNMKFVRRFNAEYRAIV